MCKIRILYIEDEMTPPTPLPAEVDKYFKITHKTVKGNNHRVSSINQYRRLLKQYENDDPPGNRVFPVEVVLADYDLSQFSVVRPLANDYGIPDQADKSTFSGFLLEIIHALHFQGHPTAIVSATVKGESLVNQFPDFEKVHAFLEDQYNASIELSDKGNSNKDNSNKNIPKLCKRAANCLRESIKRLHAESRIYIELDDLLRLSTDNLCDGGITVISNYGIRSLPIGGLFFDISPDKRTSSIQEWLDGMLQVTPVQLRRGVAVAQQMVDFVEDPKNEHVIQLRQEFAALHAIGNERSTAEESRWKELRTDYFPLKKDGKGVRILDKVKSALDSDLNDDEFRYAVLYVLADVAADAIIDGNEKILSSNEIFMRLCPMPSSPVKLPGCGGRRAPDLSSMRIPKFEERKQGKKNVKVHIPSLILGEEWDPDNRKYGFKAQERPLIGQMLLHHLLKRSMQQTRNVGSTSNPTSECEKYIESAIVQQMVGQDLQNKLMDLVLEMDFEE